MDKTSLLFCLHRGLRKALSDLSPNTVCKPRDSGDWKRRSRAPRASFGCSARQIPPRRKDKRFGPHLEQLNSKD
jgi:hypothetical protein